MTAIYHSLLTEDFYQDWSDPDLITIDDDWSNVDSIMGYRGDGLTSSTGTDPQTILADGSAAIDDEDPVRPERETSKANAKHDLNIRNPSKAPDTFSTLSPIRGLP